MIFTDNLAEETEKILTSWKVNMNINIKWDIRPPTYPILRESQEPIKKALGPGYTQRLFFPEILPEFNAVLYVDTDIIFLQDPFDTWKTLDNMTQKSFACVSENIDPV